LKDGLLRKHGQVGGSLRSIKSTARDEFGNLAGIAGKAAIQELASTIKRKLLRHKKGVVAPAVLNSGYNSA